MHVILIFMQKHRTFQYLKQHERYSTFQAGHREVVILRGI